MKLKLTPFFIASLGLFLYGLYWWFIADSGEEGWGLLFGMVITVFSVGLFVVYIIFRAIFKTRVWTQTNIETLLLCVGLFYYYKTEGAFVFTLPRNYKGHVLVVYNVEGQPTLPTNFLSNKVKVTVPSSGIVLTSSSPRNVQYYNGGIFTEDGKNINDLQGADRRYDIPVLNDTIICNGRTYRIDKWMIKDQPNWELKDDTLYKLNEKLELACDLINRKATANNSFAKVGLK
jgi:hypothetical protein